MGVRLNLRLIFERVPDPRGRQGRDYPLWSILALIVVSLLNGRKGMKAAFELGRSLNSRQRAALGFAARTPCHATLTQTLRVNTVFVRLPFAVAQKPDAGALGWDLFREMRDLDGQRLLPPTQGGVIRRRPVQTGHLQQAGHHPGRLPEWQLEKDPDGQAEPERRIRKHRRTTGAAVRRRGPGHLLVQPDYLGQAISDRSIRFCKALLRKGRGEDGEATARQLLRKRGHAAISPMSHQIRNTGV